MTNFTINKNIPALRFPEFEGEWGNDKIGRIFQVYAGGDIDKENVRFEKDEIYKYPVYANAEAKKGLYGYSNIYKIEAGSLTVAGRGVNIGITHFRDHRFYPIVRLLVLKPKINIDLLFFEYQINRRNIFVESTGVPQLTAPQLSGYYLAYPKKPEQQKIASFLASVDQRINLLTQKKEKLEQYKKGIMQRIFSQELRFRDENGEEYPEWEEKRLGEIVVINPRVDKVPVVFLYIDLESVEKGNLKNAIQFNQYEAPSRAQRVLDKGDILFQMVRPYQRNNYYFNLEGIYVASTGYAQLRYDNCPKFIYQLVHTDYFVNEVLNRCTGSSYPAINSSDLGDILVLIPKSINEQQKIAAFLSSIDDKINHTNSQIKLTRKWKQGLLQKMFV